MLQEKQPVPNFNERVVYKTIGRPSYQEQIPASAYLPAANQGSPDKNYRSEDEEIEVYQMQIDTFKGQSNYRSYSPKQILQEPDSTRQQLQPTQLPPR